MWNLGLEVQREIWPDRKAQFSEVNLGVDFPEGGF